MRRPDLTIATEDHNTPTLEIDKPIADLTSRTQIEALRSNCAEFGIRLHPLGDIEQGIVHVVGPQLGLTQPGITVVCGDSHTSTHGAFGAMALGIGTSEVEHVLATQTLPLQPFKTMAITVEGTLRPGVTAKDIILAVIAKIGTNGGQGYVLEYRGSAIRALSMDGRMTICNMSIEAGARAGMVAPDQTTYEYLKGRAHAPQGADWDAAVAYWNTLATDDDAVFDAEVFLDADELEPFVTWGTNPGQGVPLNDRIPDPSSFSDPNDRAAAERALEYMDLNAGTPLKEVRVDAVFMGSCTNSRLEDLREFAIDHQGPQEGRPRAGHGRAGFGARADRGRSRGHRQDRRRVRRRVAVRGLLDVPRDEPRPAWLRGSGARRHPIATSKAARARAGAPTWCRRSLPRRPRSAELCRHRPT